MNAESAIRVISLGILLALTSATEAQDGVVPLTAHISLEKKVVTQHEPVILEIALDNPSAQGVMMNLGNDDEKLQVKVVDPEGVEFQKPEPLKLGWSSPDIFPVAPSTRSSGSIALSKWFDFDKIGAYRIEVTLSPSSSPKEPFSYDILNGAAMLDLTVLARDEHTLESACADLLSRTRNPNSSAEAATAARALAQIKDPVAVPCWNPTGRCPAPPAIGADACEQGASHQLRCLSRAH